MNDRIKIIYSPHCLEYSHPGHPESPQRVKKSIELLKNQGYEFVDPSPAQEKDILSVHNQELLDHVKAADFKEPDTPAIQGIYGFALLSVGGAIRASDIAHKGGKAFSLMRPPGHHAGRTTLGGFCYFNNIAVAVQKLLEMGRNVAIIDFDCHHGQGTQEIFQGKNNVIYLSLHQGGIYPNTGLEPEKNCINIPLDSNVDDEDYLDLLEEGLEQVRMFKPDVIAISAGFDTYKKDPLTGINLEVETYRTIGQELSSFNLPAFAVLEGGYSEDLPECIYTFLQGLE